VATLAGCALVVTFALATASAAAAGNDALATPTRLVFGTPDQVNSSNYTVAGGEPNTTAPFNQQCRSGHSVGVARTAWYTIRGTGHRVVVSTEGSNYDTAVFVYSGASAGSLVSCNDDASGSDFQSSVRFRTTRGATYAIQVGTACNASAPSICASGPPAGNLRVTATDIPPHPKIVDGTHFSVTFLSSSTRFDVLSFDGAPPGSKISVLCSTRGLGCPFSQTSVRVKSTRRIQLAGPLHGAGLRRNAVLSVQVTKAGFIGSLTRFTIRLGSLPQKQVFCLEPGSTKPRRTCS
jgi:hypothetical protein